MTQDFTFEDGAAATAGSITIANLIADLKVYAPVGVEVPRDINTNNYNDAIITRWAEEAAQKINLERKVTTRKETNITLVADQQDYDMPADARKFIRVIRTKYAPSSALTTLDIPDQATPTGFSGFGTLPTGQVIGGSLDLIGRQRTNLLRREDDAEVFGGKLRLKFPIEAGEVIRVQYDAIDNVVASLPADYYDMILLYMRYKNLDWFIGKYGSSIGADADRFSEISLAGLTRSKVELLQDWTVAINDINNEID